jgi:hypothetical protein
MNQSVKHKIRSDPMAVNLHQLAELLRNVKKGFETFHYVNKRDHKVYTVQNMPESSRRKISGNSEIVPLPKKLGIQEYELMEIFTRSLADRQTSGTLLQLMHGKAPFLNFREGVKTAGLKDEWYRFRHEIWYNAAGEWCEANGIAYEPADPEIICRRAGTADANMITGLFLKLYFQLPSIMTANRAEMYAKYAELLTKTRSVMYVATKGNQAIGVSHCMIASAYDHGEEVEPIGHIQAIYVDPEYETGYVLPELIYLCARWARAAGCSHTEYTDAVKLFHDSSRFTCIISGKASSVTEPVAL